MNRIEIERHNMPSTSRHIEDCRTSNQSSFAPGLATDYKWLSGFGAPFHDDVAAVFWTVETRGAVSHTQPAPRHIVEREILAEHVGFRRVSVGQRMLRLVEGHADMCARSSSARLLRRRCSIGTSALRAARNSTG